MKERSNMEEERELLTSQEARNIFTRSGLSEATFHRRVNTGLIESIMPEGKQRGALYPKDQVLAAIGGKAKKPRKRKSTTSLKPTIFSKATAQDIPEIAELLLTFFSRISIPKRTAWIEHNPDIAYILKSEDKVVGCAFIMPLEEQKIIHILESQVKPPTHPHEIVTYEPGKHHYLYIRSVGILQSVSRAQRKHWASRLILGLIREIIKLGAKGIIIDKIYAQTDARHIEHLLKMLGFTQITSTAGNRNFVLDISISGATAAIRYKRALNIWRAQNEEE